MVKRSSASRTTAQVLRQHEPVPDTVRADADDAPPMPARTRRKNLARTPSRSVIVPAGLRGAPVLDLMCSRFVLALAARQGPRFNLRRDLSTLLSLTGRHLVWPPSVLLRLRAFLEHRCRDDELWQDQASLSTEVFLERFGVWTGPYEEGTVFFHLDEFAKESTKDVLAVLAATEEWLSVTLRQQDTLLERNIDTLAGLLQLNEAERALLLYGTLARYQRDLRAMLVEFKVNNAPEAYATFAEVAGVDANAVGEALRAGSRLERVGLVENLLSEHNITDLADLMKVSERLPPVLMRSYRDRDELMAVFTRPAERSALSISDFDFVRDDAQLLCALLKEAVARQAPGINVLIYGPPGTGKTELVRVVAEAAGLSLFEVEYGDREGQSLSGRDRYRSMQIAQVFLKGTSRSALLFDEVEDVFPAMGQEQMGSVLSGRAAISVSAQVGGKAWINQVLETNPVPTLWVTNHIEQIDPAFRRRFAYHLELKSPPPGARERLVRKALEGHPVSAGLLTRLTERQGLTPAQIRSAVRFADMVSTGSGTPDVDFDTLVERQLRQADHALGRRSSEARRSSVLSYELEWLNTESRYALPKMLQALGARGHGSLCFYGPPGTGKTALAEHVAQALERPLLIRRASDLLSKFVGETEQLMAAMFAEAEREQCVLLLDEADSFLLDRRGAQRPHEVSEVNEMLQGMERFKGVFICTTNLLDRMDEAALRRFTFKIAFKPLRPEQRRALFAREVLGLTPDSMEVVWPDGVLERLDRLDQLSLGDFAAVKRQSEILEESLCASAFLEQLEAEHRLKPDVRERRQMGFIR